MLLLCWNETIGKICWHGDVLRREVGHFLRRTLYFEVERQRKAWKKLVREESTKFALRREDALC